VVGGGTWSGRSHGGDLGVRNNNGAYHDLGRVEEHDEKQSHKEHPSRIMMPLPIAVGSAFDFHSGRVRHVPRWMQ
jgi:hypothetical protein